MITKLPHKKSIVRRPKKMALTAQKNVSSLYEKDFYQWTRDQLKILKTGEFNKLDIGHMIEEIESLGNSEKNAIESHMIILFLHLLKIKYQPTMYCKSWENSAENAKFRIKRLVEKNPSLRTKVSEFLTDAYFSARLQASSETGLDTKDFPKKCPWTIEELFPSLQKKIKKK